MTIQLLTSQMYFDDFSCQEMSERLLEAFRGVEALKLSEEIRQSAFETVHTEAILNVHFTSNWLFRIVQAELNEFGISHEQYNILRILRGNRKGMYCLGEIQERMLNRTANTTRLVEKLRKRGLLSRRPNPTNRRMVVVRITQAGLDLLEEMDGPIREIDQRVQAALSSEDASSLTDILERLRDRLDLSGLAESRQERTASTV